MLLIPSLLQAQIPKDKKYHLYAGATIGAWGMLTTGNDNLKPLYGVAWATAAGMGKELVDLTGYGKPEWKDLGATIIGGCISVGVITAITGLVKNKKDKHRNNYTGMVFNKAVRI